MNGAAIAAPRMLPLRLALLAHAIAGLGFALWIALIRLGWVLPLPRSSQFAAHGPLMVCGFLGTLITLERAIAANRRSAYLAAIPGAIATGMVLAGAGCGVPAALFLASSVGLTILTLVLFARQRTLFNFVGALGAMAWIAGNALWLANWPLFRVVFFWAAFIVLTISAERLELSRLMRPTRARTTLFAAASAAIALGVSVMPFSLIAGTRLTGAALIALSAWLFRYDMARRTLKQTGLPRYIAVSLLSGYAWLAIAGAIALREGAIIAGPNYDAVLHAVFVGFAMSMVFGHASIVFPAVLGRALEYRPRFWGHLALLHLSLLIRIGADLAGAMTVRRWGGTLNEIAVLWFLANTITALRTREK